VSTVAPSESPWASTVVLGNGDTVFIRPLTPDDRPALAEFHQRQSAESIYRRFFSPKPQLSEKELLHFTDVDMVDRAALAVESHDEFIAWASYERWPGRNEAEAAFMVDDSQQGAGIATLLLEHLAAIARSNGIERFTAEVLGDNRAMLAVFAKAGWPLQRRFDSGVVDLDWELADTDQFLDSVERREQRADSRAVARILLPRAVAVIGASERAGSVGDAIWRNVANSVDVPIHAVNPNHDQIHGHHCCRSIGELPDEVSLAIIAVPARDLVATIDACIDKRMRGAVIITSVDGSDIDLAALVTRARRNGLRIIGPSSMGIASPRPDTRLQAALVDVALPSGGLAISMQSGSLGGSFLRKARDVSLGVSWFVSLGDKSDISANDLLQFWEQDDNTTVIGMYTESFGNPRKFARIARRVSRTKPIVAVRTGAAATGEMGGALYQQAGLIEVPTVPALLETVRVMESQPILDGPRVAVITNSRSPGVLARAALESAGLTPVDGPSPLDWSATAADYPAAIRATLASDDVDGVMVIYAPAVVEDVDAAARDIDAAAQGATKPVIAVMLGGADGPVTPGSRVPAFTFPEQAAAVLGRSHAYARWLHDEAAAPPEVARPVNPAAAHTIINEAVAAVPDDDEVPIDLTTKRRLLATYGIEMAPSTESDPEHALADAEKIGYPIALKAVRRRPGRSARAGVALDLATNSDVTDAIGVMSDSLGEDARDLIVQAMTSPGVDVRIRCEHDDRLGAIVSVGLGGAQADAIDDRSSRLAPLSPASAAAMLTETRLTAALVNAGFDSSALVDAVVAAAQLASDHPEITELDLNPVIVSERGAVVTDAVIRLTSHAVGDGPLRRLD
jgi:acyl-CoA synthetase (NDP forming)/GNAT superfamily N-acetyltransferase